MANDQSGPPAPGQHAPAESCRSSWRYRRRVIFLTVACDAFGLWVCLAGALWLAYTGHFDAWISTFLITALVGYLGRSVLVIGSYVFGAAWDDRNFMSLLGRQLEKQD